MKAKDWQALAKYLATLIVASGGTAIYFHITLNRELGEHKTKIENLEKVTDELKQSLKNHDDIIHKLDKDLNGLDLKVGNVESKNGSFTKKVPPTGSTTTVNLKDELIKK